MVRLCGWRINHLSDAVSFALGNASATSVMFSWRNMPSMALGLTQLRYARKYENKTYWRTCAISLLSSNSDTVVLVLCVWRIWPTCKAILHGPYTIRVSSVPGGCPDGWAVCWLAIGISVFNRESDGCVNHVSVDSHGLYHTDWTDGYLIRYRDNPHPLWTSIDNWDARAAVI